MTNTFLGTSAPTWARLGWLVALSILIWLVYALWRLGRGDGTLAAGVTAAVLSIAQIIATQLFLGGIERLTPPAIAVASTAITAVIAAVGVIPHRTAILVALGEAHTRVREFRLPTWVRLLGVLYAAILLRNIFYGWFLPPYDRDGLAYHLPIMASLFQAHSIAPIPSLSVWVRSYPINGELLQLWAFAPLGLDKLVDLAFLPGVIFGASALYGIARHFGASRPASIAGAMVFAFTPTVFLRQVGSYSDAWMVAVFFMGVYLTLPARALRRTTAASEIAVFCGMCAGIIAGTKYYGLPLAFLIGALLFMRLFDSPAPIDRSATSRATHVQKLRRIVFAMAIFLVVAFLLGGYAYVRNWLVEGNPLAPAQVSFGNRVLWPGLEMEKILALTPDSPMVGLPWLGKIGLAWFDRVATVYDYNFSGAGPLWVAFGLSGAIYWMIESIRRRTSWPLAIGLGMLAVFLITPDNWRPRFAIGVLLPCSVGLALLLDRLRRWPGMLVRAGFLLMAGYVVLATLPPPEIRVEQFRDFVARSDDRSRSAAHVAQPTGAYEWIEKETFGRPAVIAYGRRVDTYPLFGADLRNTILHLHAPDESSWHAALASSQAELVVTSVGSKEDDWTRTSPAFTETMRAEPLVIYARR